jgi:hypothetical protein
LITNGKRAVAMNAIHLELWSARVAFAAECVGKLLAKPPFYPFAGPKGHGFTAAKNEGSKVVKARNVVHVLVGQYYRIQTTVLRTQNLLPEVWSAIN